MSRKTPNVVFGLVGNTVKVVTMPAGKVATVHDMSRIPGFRISSIYLLYADANDNWFCSANNFQDTGTQIGCFDKSTGATQVLNLANATEQQGSGSAVALDNLTASQLTGCGVHQFMISAKGTWMHVEMNGCGANFPYPAASHAAEMFWQMGTSHVTYAVGFSGGHQAIGTDDEFIEGTGSPAVSPCSSSGYSNIGYSFWEGHQLGTNAAPDYVYLNNCSPTMNEQSQHQSWLNNATDSYANQYPFLGITQEKTSNNGAYPEWELVMFQVSNAYSAWQSGNYATAPGGTAWRIVHTYNEPTNSQCALAVYVTPSISSDGKYAAFSSDWMGQTGTNTTRSCANHRRTDVFIVKLPSP
jgi:hypothetical protein